jgi:thiamine biosynthesis lipoprotein
MPASSAQPVAEVHTERWQALGTSVVLRHEGAPDEGIRAAVQQELDAIDLAASRFRADSELATVNDATGRWTTISPLLSEAIELALRAAELTGGAVDPTLGQSLVTLGYDRDWRALDTVDSREPIDAFAEIVVRRRRRGLWEEIDVRDDPPGVRVPRGVMLDLGATAKALAADRAARAAAEAGGGRGVLVALGGDIATAGAPPPEGWQVHVTDDHLAAPDAPGQTVSVSVGGLATSSIATRRWRHEGRSQHHVLDPCSGRPIRGPWRTVSVAAASCADANIAATAALVLGDDAEAWLTEQALPARLVAIAGDEVRLNGWPL